MPGLPNLTEFSKRILKQIAAREDRVRKEKQPKDVIKGRIEEIKKGV